MPTATPTPTQAPTASPGPIYYDFSDGSQLQFDPETGNITDYIGHTVNLIIPSTIQGHAVTGIGESAFSGSDFAHITIPEGVLRIESGAFDSCSNLEEITIPHGVTVVINAFEKCSGLTSITISSTVTNISRLAYCELSNLSHYEVDDENQNYKSVDGVLYSKDMTQLIAYPAKKQGDFVIPDGVKAVNDWAFGRCLITGVTIPSSVTEIGTEAFYDCDNLSYVIMQNGVQRILDSAFCSCNALTRMDMPSSVISIGNIAFDGCTNIAAFYFYGDAPFLGDCALDGAWLTGFHIYYLEGAQGFDEWVGMYGYVHEAIFTPTSTATSAQVPSATPSPAPTAAPTPAPTITPTQTPTANIGIGDYVVMGKYDEESIL